MASALTTATVWKGWPLARRWNDAGECALKGSQPITPAGIWRRRYLALGICNLIYVFSPQRIVLGGGVLQHPGLIENIRQQVSQLLNGYVRSTWLVERIDQYIARPVLDSRAGVLGAIALAVALAVPWKLDL